MRALSVILFLLVSSVASAQTVERTIDLSQLGYGNIDAQPVEVDGNPATEEWLLWEQTFLGTGRMRVVAVRASLCVGDWFDPKQSSISTVRVERFGDRDKLTVRNASGFVLTSTGVLTTGSTISIVGLVLPPCGW